MTESTRQDIVSSLDELDYFAKDLMLEVFSARFLVESSQVSAGREICSFYLNRIQNNLSIIGNDIELLSSDLTDRLSTIFS